MSLLIFDWRIFSRRVTARWTNQDSRNRGCHILRRTTWRCAYLCVGAMNQTVGSIDAHVNIMKFIPRTFYFQVLTFSKTLTFSLTKMKLFVYSKNRFWICILFIVFSFSSKYMFWINLFWVWVFQFWFIFPAKVLTDEKVHEFSEGYQDKAFLLIITPEAKKSYNIKST